MPMGCTLCYPYLVLLGLLSFRSPLTYGFGRLQSKRWVAATRTTTVIRPTVHKSMGPRQMVNDDDEPDLFDYFDPLLSPHAYPNGVSPPQKSKISQEEDDRYDPMRLKTARFDVSESRQSPVTVARTVPDPLVFDPRISPHAYPHGTPSTVVGDDPPAAEVVQQVSHSRVVGVLLMDHGSKNQASNDRLHELARIYQRTVGSNNVVVRAAHMELASPSIPEGLAALLQAGVDEIICHPYFLSALGRHVSEDIPEIVLGAIQSLNIQIPVVTTEPVGANTEIMVGAIQSVVQQHSEILSRSD